MKVTLGRLLADVLLYGDLQEHPCPKDLLKTLENQQLKGDKESETRLDAASTFIGLGNGECGGPVTSYDSLLKKLLSQAVEVCDEDEDFEHMIPIEEDKPNYTLDDFTPPP